MKVMRPALALLLFAASSAAADKSAAPALVDFRVLATNKTSTMQKELNQLAAGGYRLQGVMGGETLFGGSEVVAVMSRDLDAKPEARYEYVLLATNKTSTMQREMSQAASGGYRYRGQTVFSTLFGGREVVVIMERDRQAAEGAFEYRLQATGKTSTLEKELKEVGAEGYTLSGLTVGQTAFGGSELVAIMERPARR